MGTFFNLFSCESPGGNYHYEERFRWFLVTRDSAGNLKPVSQAEVEEKVAEGAVVYLARVLGCSLERDAYNVFIEEIGLPIALAIFFDSAAVNADGFTDYEGTRDVNFPKYCFFKFASFLDALSPGHIRWRPQTELASEKLVSLALTRFLDEGLQGRAAMLSRWIERPDSSAFSERKAKRTLETKQRRAFLRKLPHNLAAAIVAKRLDAAGIKPGMRKDSYASYQEWYRENPNSFHAWLSRERR